MAANTSTPHILCVNHTPEILDLLRTLLESEGYRVSTHTIAERDLDNIVALAPDLITIDYMWAESDSEWTYLTMLRMDPRTRDIPIILCTGAISHAVEMESHLAALGVRVVFKPFDIDVLLDAVQQSLDGDTDPGQSTPLNA